MSPNEVSLLEECLGRSTHYLEYGSGASTLRACRVSSVQRIWSVESDLIYAKSNVLNDLDAERRVANGQLRLLHVDIGPTQYWGYPTDITRRFFWPAYAIAPWIDCADWDLILVDGRFRVACCIVVALLAQPETVVLVHDFTWRPEYREVLEYLNIARTVDTMCEFTVKKNFDRKRAERMLWRYAFHPDDHLRGPKNRIDNAVRRVARRLGFSLPSPKWPPG